MKAEDMSKLFDVDADDLDGVDSNDYGVTEAEASPLSFDDKVNDARSLMEPEPADEIETEPKHVNENDLIVEAITKSKTPEKEPPRPDLFETKENSKPIEDSDDLDLDIPGDVEKEVDADIARFQQQLKESATEQSESSSEAKVETKVEVPPSNDPNPLGLKGVEWKAYQQIREKFPQFSLYDGNPAYRDFYRSKMTVLMSMLSTFELIKIDDRMQELSEISLRYFIGEKQVATPELIRVRLDESYRARVRVSELLVQSLGQFPAWQRYCEMLRSKLWKDHEMKGAHRRDGLTMEHMSDIEGYVSKLQGFIEQARHYDGMLRAAADSLSRQLTCLQLNEPTGFDQRMEHKIKPKAPSQSSPALENLDTIEDGSVIEAPVSKREPTEVDYGVPTDDLAELG